MKIAVLGSTGRIGSRIYEEAKDRDHKVVGISRREEADISKDLFDLSAEDFNDTDVIICSFGTWTDQSLHLKVAKHLDAIAVNSNTKLYMVGGAGSLFVAEDLRLLDSDAFPKEYYSVADGMKKGLDYLQAEGKSQWSYFSPAAVIEAGKRTGQYEYGNNALMMNNDGKSYISMEDYAVAMLDAIEGDMFIRERFTAVQL